MNIFLRIVLLVLLVEIGMIIGANISKPSSNVKFDASHLDDLSVMSLNEFDIQFSDTIKDTKGIGIGKGITQYSWVLKFNMGVDFTDWEIQTQYKDNIIYINAPEADWLNSDIQLLKQQQLDITNEERNTRMFELAKKNANLQSNKYLKQFLQVESIYYQYAKFVLENEIQQLYKEVLPDLIVEEVIITNWP